MQTKQWRIVIEGSGPMQNGLEYDADEVGRRVAAEMLREHALGSATLEIHGAPNAAVIMLVDPATLDPRATCAAAEENAKQEAEKAKAKAEAARKEAEAAKANGAAEGAETKSPAGDSTAVAAAGVPAAPSGAGVEVPGAGQ